MEREEPNLDATLDAWLGVSDELSHHELLRLRRDFDEDELQRAFHDFSSAFHPDRHRGVSEDTRGKLRRLFQRGAEAYRVLRNPKLRSAYELELATRRSPAESSSAESPRTLESLCATAAGKLHARQAERSLTEGKLDEALTLLEKALRMEGANPSLEERAAALRAWRSLAGP